MSRGRTRLSPTTKAAATEPVENENMKLLFELTEHLKNFEPKERIAEEYYAKVMNYIEKSGIKNFGVKFRDTGDYPASK